MILLCTNNILPRSTGVFFRKNIEKNSSTKHYVMARASHP